MADTSDNRDRALADLLVHVEQVAAGSANLEAMYGLESGFVYTDFWHPARDRFREVVTSAGQQEAWLSELRRQPPDLKLWVPFMDRRGLTDASLDEVGRRWDASGSERFFKPHHFVSRWNDGVAALHISLLSDLDPVAAVEYVANLPNEHLIWAAAYRLQISERPELVDRVLGESSSTAAALLCLACELDASRSLVWKLGDDRRWHAHDEETAKDADAALEFAWSETIPDRFETVARCLLTRADAGAVVGPFMRHLARSATGGTTPDLAAKSRIVRIALDAILAAVPGSTFEIERAEKPDAACVVSRILMAAERGQVVDQWDEWVALLVSEDGSLDTTNEIYWPIAGTALCRTSNPVESWTHAARRLEPILRKRARRGERGGVDSCTHLIMTAVNAAATLRAGGRELWGAAYERARRHFFVDSPPENDFGYRLSSYVFAAYPKVFGSVENLETELGLLPTRDHVQWAREQFAPNQPGTEVAAGAEPGSGRL